MCPCSYVSEDDALEVATGDTEVIKEHIVAVVCQVLENSERPRAAKESQRVSVVAFEGRVEAANIKSTKPPYGQLISRLIRDCSDHGWAQIMQDFTLKAGNHRPNHYRRMREKIDNPDW
jgi:hypothetical protein